jgi:hypothetical protein
MAKIEIADVPQVGGNNFEVILALVICSIDIYTILQVNKRLP